MVIVKKVFNIFIVLTYDKCYDDRDCENTLLIYEFIFNVSTMCVGGKNAIF